MLQLQTQIDIPHSKWEIKHTDKILLLGSCFADEIGERLVRGGFDAMVNPFGTLYNPSSIAAMLLRAVSEREYTSDSPELLQDTATGIWHSWMHHTRFSSPSKDDLIGKANLRMHEVSERLRSADVLIVTLGTALIYRLRESGMLVANCHKQPDSLFERQRLSAYDICDQWVMLLQLLRSVNPRLKVILTVSPIRHKRDGMHVNQISKGILLLAVDDIISSLSAESDIPISYFPSYELMMDELRDYRFYGDDMIHPSAVAVQYIWERYQHTFFSPTVQDEILKAEKQYARSQHREITGKE